MQRAAHLRHYAGVALVTLLMCAVVGEVRAEKPKANGPPAWNAPQPEKIEALELKGNPQRGERLYETCASCHLTNAAGQQDGTMPQLAGQHTTVVIKQLAEIRSGLRVNPVMLPFAKQLVEPQDLADVAAYIASLPVPADRGMGPGVDLDRGEELYEHDCVRCHGEHGEGNAAAFFPRIAGQHYRYIVRQLIDIASGRRGNAHPEMALIVESYSARDVSIVADYVSRLGGMP